MRFGRLILSSIICITFLFGIFLWIDYKDQNIGIANKFRFDVVGPGWFQTEPKKEVKPLKIVCLITTCPKYYETRAKAVMDTWGKRCTYIHFISTKDNSTTDLPLIFADVKEDYSKSWAKMKVGFQYAYDHYMDKVDWIVKMDDDTYLVVENLLKFLEDKNTNKSVLYGRHFKAVVKTGYVSGGAGYAMSKKALSLLIEKALPDTTFCHPGEDGYEDVEVGKCLGGVGVEIGVTFDKTGEMFHPFDPVGMMNLPKDLSFWLFAYDHTFPKDGADCCSHMAISFHYVSPEWMRALEYLLYKLKVVELEYLLQTPSTLHPKLNQSMQNVIRNKKLLLL